MLQDLLRWCMVVPFYCGMLLTSILALRPGEKYNFWEWGATCCESHHSGVSSFQRNPARNCRVATSQENGPHVSGHRPSEQQSAVHLAH